MNPRTLRISGLALLATAARLCSAQPFQAGEPISNSVPGISLSNFQVLGDPTPECTSTKRYTVAAPGFNVGNPFFLSQHFSLPAGNGAQTFQISFTAQYADPNQPLNGASVFIDGEFCPSCTLSSFSIPVIGTNPATYTWGFTHFSGTAWSTNGVREFKFRFTRSGSPEPVMDIVFRAIMVGESYTEVLGYYETPSLPLYILRDPPGGGSFGKLTSGNTTCFGQSHSVSTSLEENVWAKGKLGVAGEAGLFVTTEFELYFEAGASLTASQSETSEFEYKTCLETSSTWTTANSGTPDDIFIGSSMRYAYGMLTKIERTSCGTVTKTANFASTPVQRLSSYNHNESYIIGTIIPQVQQQIANATPGSILYKKAVQQLAVWQQAIALNTAIKASAPLIETRAFNGGDAGFEYSETQTTSESRSIQYTAILEQGLSAEFGVEVAGSGVSAGGSIKMKNEYGNGETGSNETTNTMAYTLVDSDVFDNFVVEVRKDPVFGGNVYVLDEAASRTSCRYEGGFQIDQPSLSVGTPGATTMVVNEAQIGSAVNFPLIVCNNSDITRTYFLRFDAATNAQGAVLQAFGNTLNSNDNGIALELDGGECINAILSLTQPNTGVLNFNNINLYLYSLCDEEYPPYIRSYINISAFFGTGNFGSYCIPENVFGTNYGNFIDGVQLADINNTGTGATGSPTYTNYSGQFSTALSRNAQHIITLTSGEYPNDILMAWIDYDRDGAFEPSEMLGDITTSTPYQSGSISFTVPSNAELGSTMLRVRTISGSSGSGLLPCLISLYGETEDYAVVIDNNTPQDCLGVNNGTALPGTPCFDGNPNTGSDTWNANCTCMGIPVDCAGVPGGVAGLGSPCDDSNASTVEDTYNSNCECVGLLIDCQGVPGGSATVGIPCNDGNSTTANDAWNADCQCIGLLVDCTGVPGGIALPGTPCDDGNPFSGGDAYTANCQCVGSIAIDCNGVPNGTAQPGSPCDDGEPSTGNDVFGANCLCVGLPFDCAGTPGGAQLPGTSCNDSNPNTVDDVFTANCTCVGTLLAADCAGVPGGSAQPGTACDDGDANTGNDVYNAFCVCAGQVIDCDGTVGGPDTPGSPCDDDDDTTGNDLWNASCQCLGQPIDCEGVPGGSTGPGSGCNDGNPETTNDIYNLNCVCVGILALDCNGVINGPAQPGTPCDDGNAETGEDVYDSGCACIGLLIDCEGTTGGGALPGNACDDGDVCTTSDVWDGSCACLGTALQVSAVAGDEVVYTGTTNTFSVTPVPGATGYAWTLPSGWSSNSTTAFVLVAQAGSTVGVINVCLDVNVGACVLTSCLPVNVELSTGVTAEASTSDEWFSVQPNPSNGVFQLIPNSDNGTMNITVYDGTGRTVKAPFLIVGNRAMSIDLSAANAGSYYLIATREGDQRVLPVVIVR